MNVITHARKRDVSLLLVGISAFAVLVAAWLTFEYGPWGLVLVGIAALFLLHAIIGKPYGAGGKG